MKKIIALLLIVVISISISACAPQKDDFVGEWKRGAYTILDELYYNTLTFNADGTFVLKIIMYDSGYIIAEIEGTWIWDKNNMEIKTVSDSSTTFYRYDESAKALTQQGSDYEIKYWKVRS